MKIPFHKYHALGNDYIVIDPNKIKTPFQLNPDKIRLICHRQRGVGSDGILWGPIIMGGPSGSPPANSPIPPIPPRSARAKPDASLSPLPPFSVKIFNPDGSEAEKSGNGIRIFARYLLDAGYITQKQPFELDTLGGRVCVEFLENSDLIQVDMGEVVFESSLIPVQGKPREVINESLKIEGKTYLVTCVSVGNPHCVIFLPEISAQLAKEIGPLVENHEMFPHRINMQLVKVVERGRIEIEIWERGAGYTLASGSSSCAAAAAAFRLGLVDRKISVCMPGGVLQIEIEENGHVRLTGPVKPVARGFYNLDPY